MQSRYKRGIGTQGDIDWGLYHSRHGCPFLMRGSWKREGRMKMEVSKSYSRHIAWGSLYWRNDCLCTHTLHGLHQSKKKNFTGEVSLTSLLFHQSTLILSAASSCIIDRNLLHCSVGEYLEKSYHRIQDLVFIFFFLNFLPPLDSGDFTHASWVCVSCK